MPDTELTPTAPAATALAKLSGNVEGLSRSQLRGWAADGVDGDRAVGLVVSVDGHAVAHVLANRFREDLRAAGFGNGQHGFTVSLPELSPLTAHEVRVRREADGMELPGSPKTLPAATHFDQETEQGFASLLAGIESEADEARALDFLTQQLDLLLSRRADRDSSRSARERQSQFRRRWGRLLGDDPGPARQDQDLAPRVLVIDDVVPDAGRDAGSVAILSHMRALITLGYEVGFVASRAMNDRAAQERLEQEERITTYGTPHYYSVEDVLKRQASCFDLIYLHRLSNAGEYLALTRTHQPKARIIYSVADLHHLRARRQGQVERRPELIMFSRRVALGEFMAARQADSVITHSVHEAQILRQKVGAAKIHIVPWAVAPRAGPDPTPFKDRQGLAIVGQFEHPPNPDAVYWLIRNVMPLVWAEDPAIRCLVVGHGWTHQSLSPRDERVEVVGPVPDLAAVLSRVRLTVAPMRFGAGIKGKVLESFAAGVPCVMSPVAAEGLPLRPPLEELIANDAETMAQTILRFHAEKADSRAAAAAGLAMITEQFSEERVVDAMAKATQLARQP